MQKIAFREFFTRWTLSKKMTICLFVTTSFAMIIGMLLLYNSATQEAITMNTQLSKNNLDIARGNIERQGQDIENIITGPFFDQEVAAAILNDTTSFNNPAIYNSIDKRFNMVLSSCPGVLGIAVFKNNGESITKGITGSLPYNDYQSCIKYFTLKTKGDMRIDSFFTSFIWLGLEKDPSRLKMPYCLVNLHLLRKLPNREASATMVVYYDERTLCNMYSFFGNQSYIMDKEGCIISAVDKTRIGKMADISVLNGAKSSRNYTTAIESDRISDGGSTFCTWLPTLSCYLIAVPGNNVLAATQNTVLTMLLVLAILGLIFSVISAFVLSKGLTRPVTDLKLAMEAVRDGDLSVRFVVRTSDEIGYLGVTFNVLMESISNNFLEIQRIYKQKQQSEIRLLQSQINPHLLYNTLDSALCLITKNDNRTAIHILEELSRFFKLSLSKGNFFVPFSTELSHIKSYMELQKLCRNKQIKLLVTGDQALWNAKIMKMTLQPIIENAYLHAYEGIANDGIITIALKSCNGILHIEVIDDGTGIEDEELSKLQDSLLSEEPTVGFGLWNVNQRLKTVYGSEYGLTIDSEFGEFTRVTVTLPYRSQDFVSEQECGDV